MRQTICPVVGFIIGTLVGCTVSVLYNLGKKQLISFCIDSGFTCFGLVEQNYALPEEALRELGIDLVVIPRIETPRIQPETVTYTINPEKVQYEQVEYTVLKRGIIQQMLTALWKQRKQTIWTSESTSNSFLRSCHWLTET